jgi:hypothetical protein
MSDEDCPRVYPANPDTAENPCEDCGRDERKHELPPTNVIPMRGHTHVCSSCCAQIVTERLYEGHTDECMQPELRMRRAEARILALVNAVNTQTMQIEALVMRVSALVQEHWGVNLLSSQDYGKPEDPEPDTKRSERPCIIDDTGKPVRYASDYEISVFARCHGSPYPNAEPAEPPGEAPAGAEPAAGGPERSS